MNQGIFIIAHTPLASALKKGAAHVYPECMDQVVAYDVKAEKSLESSLKAAKRAMRKLGGGPVLVLTDVIGATPCNLGRTLLQDRDGTLLTGASLPMLLRAISYRHAGLQTMADKAREGGVQGVMAMHAERCKEKDADE